MKINWVILSMAAFAIWVGAASPAISRKDSVSAGPTDSGPVPETMTDTTERNPEVVALKIKEQAVVKKLLEQYPNDENVLVVIGNVHEHHGDFTAAMKCWNRILTLNPNRADAYMRLGALAMGKGQYDEAIQHWRKALQINPKTPGMLGRIAQALMRQGKHSEAIEELEKGIRQNPNSAVNHFYLGQAYVQTKQYAQAKPHYQKAVALNPNLINAYYGLFTVCSRLKQQGEARYHMAKFKKLMAEDMKHIKDGADAEDDLLNVRRNAVQTFVDSAMIYRRVGKLPEAAALFERALELNDEHVRAIRELAFIYLDTGRETAVALQMAQKAVQIEPTASHYYLLGWAHYKNDQPAQALAALRRATVMEPSNAQYKSAYQMILKRREANVHP